ncbi:MAG TPA: FtsX-like permease family protein [Hyphomonadaceae bacterium]|nr:FtsX-like permease family protein [Hyphomonadaceae bacterium]
MTAVLKDFPSNTTLDRQVFASGGFLAQFDARPGPLTGVSGQTYVRVAPETTPQQLQRALDAVAKPTVEAFARQGGTKASLGHVALADVHLTPSGAPNPDGKPPASRATALAFAAVGSLIVLVAGINFVTLMTARASRRALEVGVRKANGARRSDLIVQFMGEALVLAFLSMLIAVGIAGVLAQPFSDFMQRDLAFDFIGDPMLTGSLILATLVIGILGGFYPALVLSSFRPGAVLKGGQVKAAGSAVTRQALVVVQFAILIGLIISTITIYQQTRYALSLGLGKDSERIIQVRTGCQNAAVLQEMRKVPGVERAACTSPMALRIFGANPFAAEVTTTAGTRVTLDAVPIQFEHFETYGVKPLAGRLFEQERGAADNPPFSEIVRGPPFGLPRPIVLNQTAIRQLGYASPQDAVGKQLVWTQPSAGNQPSAGPGPLPSEIIGVVPDMPVSISELARPTIYHILDGRMGLMSIRFRPDADVAHTLEEIRRVWKATNNILPIQIVFLSDYQRTQYLDIIIQGTLIGMCAAAAIVIACLGLFALSAFAAERRTKEIGIRKALGATTFSVLRLLMWQFTVPVLIAIVIALPAGYLAMANWLQSFAYHIDLSPLTFASAALAALAIAWLTVFLQTWLVARAKPVRALRHD